MKFSPRQVTCCSLTILKPLFLKKSFAVILASTNKRSILNSRAFASIARYSLVPTPQR